MLTELVKLIPAAAPQKILVDFEKASMNAFAQRFPQAVVTGCYFHLSQSIVRKVSEIGMKSDYENDNDIRCSVRCLAALAFVPAVDVQNAFTLLADSMPHHDHMDELISFFEHTYVRGRRLRGRGELYGPSLFPIEVWNQHDAAVDGIARTTNAVEGWHHGLQSLFQCHHPTMWTFLRGLNEDMQKQKAVFLQGNAGAQRQTAKIYRVLHERVTRAVASYGRAEVLVFLRSMAHLSYS